MSKGRLGAGLGATAGSEGGSARTFFSAALGFWEGYALLDEFYCCWLEGRELERLIAFDGCEASTGTSSVHVDELSLPV